MAGQHRTTDGRYLHLAWSGGVWRVYHQYSKNLLVSYSPKKLGFF
ncbi:hypothetical protein [Streptomyces sp. C]|nr:hypothetical protein [Streptomyces sp. C]